VLEEGLKKRLYKNIEQITYTYTCLGELYNNIISSTTTLKESHNNDILLPQNLINVFASEYQLLVCFFLSQNEVGHLRELAKLGRLSK